MLEIACGIVRPAVVVIYMLATAAFVATKTPIPAEWWGLGSAVVGFYFGSRASEKAAKVVPQ